jgi:ectoine hydroxylase-related dioxygenase (phytanoyl-CoA dioxygenase family)
MQDASIDTHVQRIREDGYTILKRAVPDDIVTGLMAALERTERGHGLGYAKTSFEGLKTLRINNLLVFDEAFWQVPLFAAQLAIAEAVLDRELLLSSYCSLVLGPGQEAQPLHEDTQLIPLPRPHPTLAVNCIWALSDFTAANGATRIVPKSHLRDRAPRYGEADAGEGSLAAMPAGSIMMFDSALWHAGGANTSAARRYALSCYYGAGWLRQQENLQLGIPRETAARMPRRLQELIGYSIYKGQFGHIDNRDPISLLGETAGRPTVWAATDARIAERAKATTGRSEP